MIHILSRNLRPLQKSTRCRAHNGQIKTGSPVSYVRLSIDGLGPFNVPVCRVCDGMEDADLIRAMITEARRHNATGDAVTDFTRLMARQG